MMTRMIRILILGPLLLVLLFSCDKMEDNYEQYLEKEKIYPPKVTNLVAIEGLREVSLTWDNPSGDLAKKILVDYGDDSLLIETMVDSVHIGDLEIKGYNVSVYTLDEYNNRSVPESTTIFPNGEN
ncbi:MAG: DUF4998 domain-containing protein [Bacteroidales bacterium]|nr:DUF4998 domain-containing protein [Bacteroidales bacterium]